MYSARTYVHTVLINVITQGVLHVAQDHDGWPYYIDRWGVFKLFQEASVDAHQSVFGCRSWFILVVEKLYFVTGSQMILATVLKVFFFFWPDSPRDCGG